MIEGEHPCDGEKVSMEKKGVWSRLTASSIRPRQALTSVVRTPDRHKDTGGGWGHHRLSASVLQYITWHGLVRPGRRAERRGLVKKSSYREQDSVFGKLMLTLRTAIGLTQARLAALLGVSRNAVGGWEVGQSYPKAEHLKAFIALALQQHVFAAGREAEEVRALWRAAHQKVLLDEPWLHELLSQQASPPVDVAGEQTRGADLLSAPPAWGEPWVDWGEALDVPSFYGREEELALLSGGVGEARCRVVSVLGMGGIGKSALAVTAMQRVARQFEVVIWHSLRDAPKCSALVEECLQVLAPQRLQDLADSLEERLRLLMEQLRTRRVLLVLDNLETLLEEGTGTGRMRAGFEGYARLLQRALPNF